MTTFIRIFTLIISLSCATSAQAHHSFAAIFQPDAKITIEGVVTKYSFKNPHVLIYMDVANEDGSTTGWISEGAAATNMRRNGWDANTFSEGDTVRVFGDSTHDGSPMTSIDTADKLNLDSGEFVALIPQEGAIARSDAAEREKVVIPLTLEDGRPNLTGAWTSHGMADGRPRAPEVPFNDAGLAKQAAFDLANDPQVFCDAPGLARQAAMTPHPYRITQYDARVVFEYEEYAGYREVYFDDRDHKGVRTHLGDAIARYEGDTLVIETTNLLANQISPHGNVLSDQATIVENYKRADDDEYGSIVALAMHITDPVYLAEEFVWNKRKMSAGEYEFIGNDCHAPLRARTSVNPAMNFFLTDNGPGDGANLGGLAGADAHCSVLAETMNQGDKNWVAYLSTTGPDGVNARDRIGSGPWYNAAGELVAIDVEDLHGESNNLVKQTVLSQQGAIVNGRGDEPNRHDILTGSDMNGLAVTSDSDTSCGNWTSNSSDGSALVGHFDREGGGDNPTSWNSSHASRGCSQADLQGTGGDGLFYCFAK